MTFSGRTQMVAAGYCVMCTLCVGSSGCGGETTGHDSDASSAAGASGVAASKPGSSGDGGSDAIGRGAGGATAGTGGVVASAGVGGTNEQSSGAAGAEPTCSGTDQTLVPCFPAPQDCDLPIVDGQTQPGDPWYVLLDVSSLGPNASLVAIDGNAVLAHVAEGLWQVVRLDGPAEPYPVDSEHLFSVWDFPDPAFEPIGVADPRSDITPYLVALACKEGECRLFGAPQGEAPNAPVLTELSLPALPAAFAPSGLAVSAFRDVEHKEFCAMGNGMICLMGDTWQTVIPAQAGIQLVDVLLAEVSVAIATGGHWYKREGDAQWVEQAPLPVELDFVGTLREKRTSDERYHDRPVIVGDDRLWKVESSCPAECSLDQPREAALGADLVEAGGANLVLAGSPTRWCEDSVLDLGGPVLKASAAPCGDADTPRVLTATRVTGQDRCYSLL